MAKLRAIALALALALALVALASPARAGHTPCLACHLTGQERTLGALAWRGPLAVAEQSLCPGVRAAARELLFTESRLAQAADLAARLEVLGVPVAAERARLVALGQDYRSMLNRPVRSLEGMRTELAGLRGRVDRAVLRPLWLRQQARSRARAGGLAVMALLVIALAALAGWHRLLGAARGGPGRERRP